MLHFGILGNPVKHSKSPLIHNAWLKKSGVNGNYDYILVENQEDLAKVFNELQSKDFTGVNVTVPYKNEILTIAQNAGFRITREVEEIGAANTINFKTKEVINTDSYGFSKIYSPNEGDHILVIGAGGVAPAIIYSCKKANITITNRTIAKAEELAERFMCDLYAGELSKLDLSNFDAIINATSLGLNNEDIPLNYKTLQKYTICVDTIYNPRATPFLQNAQKKGCKVQNGTMMLIHQGAKSFQNWTGLMPNIQTAENLLKDFLL